jgi:hypothetical protein
MAVIAFLNELSQPSDNTPSDAAQATMPEFARVVGAIRKRRPDLTLQLPEPLKAWRLGENYSFVRFLSDGRTKEEAQLILTTVARSPLRFGLDPTRAKDNGVEYEHGGRVAEGLGLAHIFEGLAVSFKAEAWLTPRIDLGRQFLTEDEQGEIKLQKDDVQVIHASSTSHVAEHHAWLETTGKPHFASYQDFVAERPGRLPNLKFLDRALKQIEAIKPGTATWKSIFERLDELQAAVIEWDPASAPQPAWRSYVTGEGETRQRLCYFNDLDGTSRCFDEHARFTPGAGRIHFRLDASKKDPSLIVAHVGEKLA